VLWSASEYGFHNGIHDYRVLPGPLKGRPQASEHWPQQVQRFWVQLKTVEHFQRSPTLIAGAPCLDVPTGFSSSLYSYRHSTTILLGGVDEDRWPCTKATLFPGPRGNAANVRSSSSQRGQYFRPKLGTGAIF
jgi:hypothetical protein